MLYCTGEWEAAVSPLYTFNQYELCNWSGGCGKAQICYLPGWFSMTKQRFCRLQT